RARVDAGAARAGALGEELRRLGAAEAEARRDSSLAASRAGAVEVELARLGVEAREARRRLDDAGADPAEGGDRGALLERGGRLGLVEDGVEVQLRPAGKRVTRLSLLSGGEKALGAIAFLFALFLARPCPFYLLDEVEAALDDTNIGRFVALLRRYADRAQFI